ncbi:hypothetical protein SK128_020035, partial [Halocaridina rubra]
AEAGGMTREAVPFKTIKKATNYEIRHYPEGKWICKENIVRNCTIRLQIDGYMALREYILGKNHEGTEMNNIKPLTMKKTPNYDKDGNSRVLMCKYLPRDHQENIPKPLEEGLIVELRPAMTVFVRSFKAYLLRETRWEDQLQRLISDLRSANETQMDVNNFYGVTYDPPFQIDGRRSEIWLVKEED